MSLKEFGFGAWMDSTIPPMPKWVIFLQLLAFTDFIFGLTYCIKQPVREESD